MVSHNFVWSMAATVAECLLNTTTNSINIKARSPTTCSQNVLVHSILVHPMHYGFSDSNLSLVFCGYQQVYYIFSTSCLGTMLQVRGHDGMSTPQNGAAAYSESQYRMTIMCYINLLTYYLPTSRHPTNSIKALKRA